MTHATCRLTAKNRDQLRKPTLSSRVWATFLPFLQHTKLTYLFTHLLISDCAVTVTASSESKMIIYIEDSHIINISVEETAIVVDSIRIVYIINLKSGNRTIKQVDKPIL